MKKENVDNSSNGNNKETKETQQHDVLMNLYSRFLSSNPREAVGTPNCCWRPC